MPQLLLDIWESYKRVNGPAITFLVVVLAIIPIAFDLTGTISASLRWFSLATVVLCFVLLTTFLILIDLLVQEKKSRRMPATIAAIQDGQREVLLLEPCSSFGIELMVSVFYKQQFPGGMIFERYIGNGFVAHIQEQGKIQIEISAKENAHKDVWDRILKQEPELLKALVIKPSIPRRRLN